MPASAVFNTNHKIAENYAGVYAPADRGLQHATVIVRAEMFRDPQHNQMRPYLCAYEYADRCSLRIVPLGKAPHLPGHVKLQLVMFDEYGFVNDRFDFPKRN